MAEDRGNNGSDVVAHLRAVGAGGMAGVERDLTALVNYWQGMRRGGDVPLRSAIDPRGIENLLSHAFIAEKVAPGLARLRVAGTHLSDLMGMEIRGMPLSALIDPGHRDQLADALVNLFEQPAQIRLTLYAPGSLRRAALTGALVILPLRSDLGDISRALGCLVTRGPLGLAPRRFEITECRVTPLDLKITRAPGQGPVSRPVSGSVHPPSAAPQAKTARRTAPPPMRHASERPYLRLVRNE